VLEGEHIIGAYVERHGDPETLLVAQSVMDRSEIRRLLDVMPSTRVLIVAESAWSALGPMPAAAGVVAIIPAPAPVMRQAADFCLLLDDVQDPGNVGSILRSAAAAGVAQVFLSPRCAFAWSPKVLRAGQGAHFHLELYEAVDLAAWARDYAGRVVAAITTGGESLFTADLAPPIALAVGNEGAGLSSSLRAAARQHVTIPMPGGFESLNAAAAAATCLFECVRRRTAAPFRHP